MSNSIIFQKQVRDNSTDLHSYVKELSSWEEEMKRKEVSRGDLKDPEVWYLKMIKFVHSYFSLATN